MGSERKMDIKFMLFLFGIMVHAISGLSVANRQASDDELKNILSHPIGDHADPLLNSDFTSPRQRPLSVYEGDLSPKVVAEYLVVTGDFTSFERTLQELREAHLVTDEGIIHYKETVTNEYNRLMRDLFNTEMSSMAFILGDSGIPPSQARGAHHQDQDSLDYQWASLYEHLSPEGNSSTPATDAELEEMLHGIVQQFSKKRDGDIKRASVNVNKHG